MSYNSKNLMKSYTQMYASLNEEQEARPEKEAKRISIAETRKKYSGNVDELYESIFNEHLDELLDEGVIKTAENDRLEKPIDLTEERYIRVNPKYLRFMVEKYMKEETSPSSSEKKETLVEETLTEETITEESAQSKTYIDELAGQLGDFAKKQETNSLRVDNGLQEDMVIDPQYAKLEAQISQLRRMVHESTMVHSIGQSMTAGTGEVKLQRMDDFRGAEALQPGDPIVWDGDKFVPGSVFGAQGTQGVQAKKMNANVTISSTSPPGPVEGDLWFNGHNLYVFYVDPNGTASWVEANP